MTRAWALAILFFALAASAAFHGNKVFAIVWGIPALCLTLFGLARAAAEDDECERHEAWEEEQPKTIERPAPWTQERRSLRPDEVWRSSAPIPPGVDVAVQIEGTYAYCITNGNGRQYADGRYTWTEAMNPGAYKPHDFLYFDANDKAAVPFFENRPLHTYRFLYTGTGMHMEVFLRRHAAFIYYCGDPRLTISIGPLSPADQEFFRAEQEAQQHAQEDDRRRKEEAAAAERQREAEEREHCRQRRLQTLEVRYSKPDLSWRTDASARLRYAQEHRGELLKRRQETIADFEAFHRDSDFTERLRTAPAPWHARIDEIFYFEMVSIAENLPREPARDKPPPTPDERREQELSWSKVKTRDYRERAKLRLTEERDFIEELLKEFPNLTEGELQLELQRFRDEGLEMPSQRRNHDHAPGGPSGATQSRVL